ncbi:CU044_5270 family protein [Kribbella sp. VKM Ac-2568]|uniref:CU044_5270 family protein n=1 Tax=Kribbella sp. VKM Ac-2568 TaxID=2512219 RepID=UPI001043EAF5|nr:CU044_5270 family protein [Kribbella sp. VKM Ac-2568]TCM37530.1 hypothetical protein EV648_11979 [Kribbella sp. VKM Ac-2568]
MDELHKIRSAYPEQPGPSAEVTAQARQQIQALAREAATARRRDRWHAAARSGRVGVALTATAAAVALAALATPLILSPDSGPDAAPVPSTMAPTPRLMTASQVLMAVAVKQEGDEKVSGKYYRVRSLQMRATTEVGAPGKKYHLERRNITESWMPMKQGVESWFGWADLGARPATPADTAKWKAQGSPKSWQLDYEVDPVTMAAGEPTVRKMTFAEVPPGYYLSGIKPVTAQQIQALPTDPVKLRAVLARGAEPGAAAEEIDYVVFNAAGRLLFETPSPPKLRGAALRVLSELPGTQYKENVKDPIGRTGTRITMAWPSSVKGPTARKTAFGDGGTSYIIEPTTGRLLSSETIGIKRGASVVLESGWTDDSPEPPSPAIR